MNYNFCVILSEKNKRVDMYLSALFEDFSRSYIQKMIDRWQVSVNGETIKKNVKIKDKDELNLEIKLESLELKAEKMDLDIVFEDDNILVINKDSWVNVHPVPWEWWKTWTLVNAILYHCKTDLPSINWVERPGIVHRLDKDTSWLIMIAKTDKMMNYLSSIIKDRKIDKYYIAIVNGIVKEKNFKIESYIGRDQNDRQKMTWKNPVNPKIALTYGEVLEYIDDKYTLLKVKIETWRTHQIRVHLASIGFPILGDKVYGSSKINKEVELKYGLKRQALHARELKLELYGKEVEFFGDLKGDMRKIIKK